jgi:hypothetical protein
MRGFTYPFSISAVYFSLIDITDHFRVSKQPYSSIFPSNGCVTLTGEAGYSKPGGEREREQAGQPLPPPPLLPTQQRNSGAQTVHLLNVKL